MEYVLIILSSVTYARKVQLECEKRGITASIGHTPKKISEKGCSFALKVKRSDLKYALDIIEVLMLKVYGVYLKTGDDSYDLL